MIRVFSFVGSCAGKQSQTRRYSDLLAEALRRKAEAIGETVSYECMTGDMLRVEYCRSCGSCFSRGFCPLDEKDDMALLKRKMLDCDIFFFGTPVYMADMSGIAKSVIDRTSYWAHRFELAGKAGAVFATTSATAGMETAERITYMLRQTGLVIVHTGQAVTRRGHPNIHLEEEMAEPLEKAAEELLKAWRDPAECVFPTQDQTLRIRSAIYRQERKFYDLIGKEPENEILVWESRHIGDYPSFAAMTKAVKEAGGWPAEKADQQGEH